MNRLPNIRARGPLLTLALLGLLAQTRLHAQGQGWIGQRYTTRNGLPQNSVLSLAMDSVGFLWITTEGGVVRCDGGRFKRLPVSSTGKLGPERMRQLIPTLANELYVNDSRGQLYIIHGHGTVIPVSIGSMPGVTVTGGFPSAELFARALDRETPLAGRARWPGLQLNVLPANAHDWFVQCEGMLLAYRDSSFVDSIPIPDTCSRLFLNAGRVFGFDALGAFRVDAGQRGVERVRVVDQKGLPLDLRKTDHAVLWLATDPYAYLHNAHELYALAAAADGNELVARHMDLDLPQACLITSVVVNDKHRMVAVGTDTKGLFLYHPRYMRTVVAVTEGATSNAFYAQAPMPGDRVMVATNSDRVVLFDEDGRSLVPPPVPVFSFEGVFRDRDGDIWYSPKPGLERYSPSTGEHTNMLGIPTNSTFTRFLQEGDSLWVTDEYGIHCWRNGKLRLIFPYTGGEAFRHAQFLRRRDADHLWFGTCDGLYTLSTSTGKVDTIEAFRGRCVRTMEKIDGRWLVGTYGSGAFIQHRDEFRPLPTDPHGHLSHVHAFMPDAAGGLWMSTNQGLFRMHLRDIWTVLSDSSFRPHLDYFGEWAGIENSEFNGGCDPPYVRLSDGTASFPTLAGLVWFKPEGVPDMWPTSPVFMEEVLVDGRALLVHEHKDFDPGAQVIEVRFSLPYWGDPENVHLEYWLKGRPGSWTPVDPGQRALSFRDLPPGEYDLLVRKNGSPDLAGAGKLVFTIRRHLYQRTWARVAFAVLAGLIIWGLVRLNEARLRRKNRRLEERVRMRTRALEDANRELQRSMELKHRLVSIISHDIVTPLRFIARVARSGTRTDALRDATELSETLRDISFSADKLYTNARNTLSWIRNQEGGMELRLMHVALNPLVEEIFDVCRALAQSKDLRLSNEVSLDDVLRTDRDVLSIILHNLITNAVTHTGLGEVRVSGEQVEGGYVITVADTGHGMSQQALAYISSLQAGGPIDQGTANEEGVHGLGYVIIIELVRLLEARIEIASTRETGTRVIVRLPVA